MQRVNRYDLNQYQWSEEIWLQPRLTREAPEFTPPSMWREIGSKVAEELGLKPGTSVVVGGGDGACATGGGNFRAGSSYVYVGSSSWIASLSISRFMTRCSLPPGSPLTTPSLVRERAECRRRYQWLGTLCGQEVRAGKGWGSAVPAHGPPGETEQTGKRRTALLPYLLGERSPTGTPCPGLLWASPEHRRSEMIRSVLEG